MSGVLSPVFFIYFIMGINGIDKVNNINNLTDVNDIKRTQKDKTEQDKDVQNVGYKNSTTKQGSVEGKVYHDDMKRCKEYFIQSLKDNNVLKSISLDEINEIFNKYLKDQVTSDDYSNPTIEPDIFTRMQQSYGLDPSVISIIKTCFTKAKKRYKEPDDDDESEEEEKLLGESINRNNTSLNIIFNSNRRINMKKTIKSDYREYAESQDVPYEGSYYEEFDDMVEEWGYDVNDRFTYMAGIRPEDWEQEDTDSAAAFHVDVAGYYILGDQEGIVLVGTLKDIFDYCDNYWGMGLHPDYVCPADSFDYEDGEWVTGGWIDSSRKPVKSNRLIKSGTSNFGSNNDIFGYSFPLVTYIAENYVYDEETDSETEERDYDADSWEYEDALSNAKDLADEMNIPQYDDYSEPYLCYEPFMIKFRDGYYEGLWIEVKEGTDETPYDENGEYQGNFDWKPFTEEQMNKFADKLNEYFNRLCSEYGWQKLGVSARFDNGEVWYSKIDNSRKPIQSKITQRELKDMIRTGQAIDITYGDAPEGVRLDVLQISKGTYGMNGALFKGSDGNLYVIGGRTTNLFRYV